MPKGIALRNLQKRGMTQHTRTFIFVGRVPQYFVVPSGVSLITVDVYGAAGGQRSGTTNAGKGGRVRAALPVTPGETLELRVGGQGAHGHGLEGGYNGGGTAGSGSSSGNGDQNASGGGASDIRQGGNALINRVIVAGGGAGQNAWPYVGGHGGGTTGGAGASYAGQGGTQSAGGAGGGGAAPGQAGSLGQGGNATSTAGWGGSGGGGGYYGGGGGGSSNDGSQAGGSGGGGSSYAASGTTDVVHDQGVRSGDGQITLTYEVVTGVQHGMQVFDSNGAFGVDITPQDFVVPTGVTQVFVDAYGASGYTAAGDYETNTEGKGGHVRCILTVTPGETLKVYAGWYGYYYDAYNSGWNGGQKINNTDAGIGTGGGATDIRRGGTALSNRIIVAGGGGGASTNPSPASRGGRGGAGGGTTGGSAPLRDDTSVGYGTVTGGTGGTQAAGGSCGGGQTHERAPGLGIGGVNNAVEGGAYHGGNGGGGYYGGGAGGRKDYCGSGGGGGSSYTDGSCSSVIHNQGVRTGGGRVVLQW